MKLSEEELAFLYVLYKAKERGEFVPLSLLARQAGLDQKEARLVGLSVENKELVEVDVDERLLGNGRYKYRLSARGLAVMTDILKIPTKRVGRQS